MRQTTLDAFPPYSSPQPRYLEHSDEQSGAEYLSEDKDSLVVRICLQPRLGRKFAHQRLDGRHVALRQLSDEQVVARAEAVLEKRGRASAPARSRGPFWM